MTDSVYVNADRTKIVDENSPEAAYRIHAKEAKRLGLKAEPASNKDMAARAKTNGTPRRTKTTE